MSTDLATTIRRKQSNESRTDFGVGGCGGCRSSKEHRQSLPKSRTTAGAGFLERLQRSHDRVLERARLCSLVGSRRVLRWNTAACPDAGMQRPHRLLPPGSRYRAFYRARLCARVVTIDMENGGVVITDPGAQASMHEHHPIFSLS